MDLTRKQRLFVIYYLGKAKANGTLAARMAGYGSPEVAASKLLRKGKVREAIDSALDRAAMSADETLVRISCLASSDMGDFLRFNPDASPDDLPSLDMRKARRRDKLGNIKKLKRTVRTIPRGRDKDPEIETEIELELYGPDKALAMLAKYHGLDNHAKEDSKVDDDFGMDLSENHSAQPPDEAAT